MKERPILFNAQSVRAILEGRKSQTRRVVKLPKTLPQSVFEYGHIPQGHFSIMQVHGKFSVVHWESDHAESIPLKCPYEVGMNLWVRETWQNIGFAEIVYRASYEGFHGDRWGGVKHVYRWRPSIHMPRWASRITLEVLDVRVERIQDIKVEDVPREGLLPWTAYFGKISNAEKMAYCINEFAVLWDSINKKRGFGWDTNCWCWCISFKVIGGSE